MTRLNLICALCGVMAGLVLGVCIHVATAISGPAACASHLPQPMHQFSPHEKPEPAVLVHAPTRRADERYSM